MNNIQFYNSFWFRYIALKNHRHNDNSQGIPHHFLARLRYGSGKIVTDQKAELHLRAGDVFYLPRGLCYHSYWYGDPACENRVEWDSFAFSAFPSDREHHFSMKRMDADTEMNTLFDSIAADPTVNARSVGLFCLLLDRVFPNLSEAPCDQGSVTFAKALHYIESHTDLHVPKLAKHCGMSESGIYAMFQRYAQTTPIEMKNKIIADRAIVLLQSTNLSIEEISDRLVFCNTAYFRKIIKRCTQKTPSELRRESKLI